MNYAVKSSLLLSFLESVPDVAAKLKEPNTKEESFKNVVKAAQDEAVLVLVYRVAADVRRLSIYDLQFTRCTRKPRKTRKSYIANPKFCQSLLMSAATVLPKCGLKIWPRRF